MKLLLLLLALTGCAKGGERVDPANAKGDYGVDELFTVKGCTVYRFYDAGHYRYFTTCNGTVSNRQTIDSDNNQIPEEINTTRTK